ncbi:MAG TPA: hypothetical protein EYG69_00440 [Campylobacterales bacterium]|nr:hypothetical protein [Campylobacterales bacterium]
MYLIITLERCSTIYGKTIVLDLISEEIIYLGNRFMLYAIYLDMEISIHKMWGFQKRNIFYSVGKSIINKESSLNIGALMLEYKDGGHLNARTCKISHESAEIVLKEIISKIEEQALFTV